MKPPPLFNQINSSESIYLDCVGANKENHFSKVLLQISGNSLVARTGNPGFKAFFTSKTFQSLNSMHFANDAETKSFPNDLWQRIFSIDSFLQHNFSGKTSRLLIKSLGSSALNQDSLTKTSHFRLIVCLHINLIGL